MMNAGKQVSYASAVNAMRLIARGAVSDAWIALGIPEDDFTLACSEEPYIATDRNRVKRVVDHLIHGVCDVVGVVRVQVPVEFLGAVLAVFIAPGNLAVACRWVERSPLADDFIEGGSVEQCTAEQLLSLALKLSPNAPTHKDAWEKKFNRVIRLEEERVNGPKDAPVAHEAQK